MPGEKRSAPLGSSISDAPHPVDTELEVQELKFNKPDRDPVAESKLRAQRGIDPNNAEPQEEPPVLEKAPTHWLDLIIYLLAACRKASTKMRTHAGVDAYRRALVSKGQNKLRVVGNIVDTRTVMTESSDDSTDKKTA